MIIPYYSFQFPAPPVAFGTTQTCALHFDLIRCHLSWINLAIVHPKIKILSLLTYLHCFSQKATIVSSNNLEDRAELL